MKKQCPVCDATFTYSRSNQKYCSEECRIEQLKVNDKLRKRKERAEQRVIFDAEKARIIQEKKEAREKEAEQRINEQYSELMARVKANDPLARMQVTKPQSKEYWEAYKDYAIQYAENWDSKSDRIVNGISVYEDKFAVKVISSIEELGHIKTSMFTHER